ncbi:MAG: hypothetical protein ACLP5H_13585 [Desulfomonilaceae bacterium]
MTIYFSHNSTTPPQSASHRRLDNLVFDMDEFALAEDGQYAARPDAIPSHESKTVQEQATAVQRPPVSLWAHLTHTLAELKTPFSVRRLGIWTTATIMLSLAAAGMALYIAWSDGYHVETKLFLFDRDHDPNNPESRALEQEVEILKSPQILHLLSRELYDRQLQGLAPGGHLRAVGSATTKGLSRFGSPDDLEKWLVKKTYFSSEVSGGMAKVALHVRGDDPAFLSSVLDSYICRYVDYRRTLETESANQLQPARRHEQHPPETNPAGEISAQLQKIEFQERGSKLVLQLIDSGKGVFSGFVPDQSLTGVPSLTHFQEKIVQLEIKKRALAAQYMPSSREIVVVDLEVQGVRSAMRECLVEHLQFLRKEREQLLAQKDEPYHNESPVAGHNQVPNKEGGRAQPSLGGDSWLVPRDGLYVLRETPVIAQRPVLARTGHFANKLIAYLAPSSVPTVISESDRNQSPSLLPGLSVDGRVHNSGESFQGSPTQHSFQPMLTTPPVWQRAATSYSDAQRPRTGPTNSRPRQ